MAPTARNSLRTEAGCSPNRLPLLLLLVACLVAISLQALSVKGDVLVMNLSTSNVSVFDQNTTLILDLLMTNQNTSFPLGSRGPDIFIIQRYANGPQGNFSQLMSDGQILKIFTQRGKFKHEVIDGPSASPPT